MKDKKYYTPSVEEFYIGFEYEYKTTTNITPKHSYNWRKVIEDHDKIEERYWSELVCRVKYLDKEDIESLGFKLSWNDYQHLYYTNRENTLILFTINNNKLEIFNSNIKEKFKSVLFRGNIKNKSELKILLKQLNIL